MFLLQLALGILPTDSNSDLGVLLWLASCMLGTHLWLRSHPWKSINAFPTIWCAPLRGVQTISRGSMQTTAAIGGTTSLQPLLQPYFNFNCHCHCCHFLCWWLPPVPPTGGNQQGWDLRGTTVVSFTTVGHHLTRIGNHCNNAIMVWGWGFFCNTSLDWVTKKSIKEGEDLPIFCISSFSGAQAG